MRARLTVAAIACAALLVASGCSDRAPEPAPAPPAPSTATAASSSAAAAASVPSAAQSALAPAGARVGARGLSVAVPSSFVPLEADKVQRLRDAVASSSPAGTTLEIDARRDPAGMRGAMIYVMRMDPPAKHAEPSVRAELMAAEGEMRIGSRLSGLVENVWRSRFDGAILTVDTKMTQTTERGSVNQVLLAKVFITAERRMAIITAVCMPAEAAVCQAMSQSAQVDAGPVLGLDEPLNQAPQPAHDLAGFTLGQSRNDFVAACKKAGHAVDAFDWKKETPNVKRWVDEGSIARCNGAPGPLAKKPVLIALATFHEDRLVSLALLSKETQAEIQKRLEQTYPDSVLDMQLGTRYFNPHALSHLTTGLELLAVEATDGAGFSGANGGQRYISNVSFNAPLR